MAIGNMPEADPSVLRANLDAAGLQDVDAEVGLILGGAKDLLAEQQQDAAAHAGWVSATLTAWIRPTSPPRATSSASRNACTRT